jgi:tetratricopeptide (TPR) repeat protein
LGTPIGNDLNDLVVILASCCRNRYGGNFYLDRVYYLYFSFILLLSLSKRCDMIAQFRDKGSSFRKTHAGGRRKLPTHKLDINSDQRIGHWWLLVIFVVAIAYRAVCFCEAGGHPLFRFPVVDAQYHDEWAKRMAAGDWLGHGPDDVFKPPLYPFFLAVLYRVFGRSIWLIQWFQHILGAFSCVFLAILGGRLVGRRAGRIAGLFAAGFAPYVFFELQLLTPTLSLFLNLGAIILVLPSWENRCYGRLLAAGLLLGLSAGVRPDVIMPASLVLLYLVFENRGLPTRQLAIRILCLFVGGLAIVLPIIVRNHHLTGQFIPVSSNSGINLYVGNSTDADGISSVPVGLRWEQLICRVPQEVLEKPATASRWWAEAARREIMADPAAALLRLGKKALAFFNRREFRNNICYHFMQKACWSLRVSPFQLALILPMAACGLVRLWCSGNQKLRRACVLCVLWVSGYLIVGVAFFVTARFRLPATPFLILPAACALVEGVEAVWQRQWQTLVVCIAVMLCVGIICWPCWFGAPENGWARDYVNLSNSFSAAGERIKAMESCRRAIEIESQDPDAHFLLGRMLLPGNPTDALKHFEVARKRIPDSPSLLLAIGQVYLQVDNMTQGREILQELFDLSTKLNMRPKRVVWATAYILMAEIEPLEAKKHWEKAWSIDPRTAAEAAFLQHRELPRVLKTFQAEALEKPWDWYSQANLGLALLEAGHADEAVEVFRKAAQLAPDREGIPFQLARALLQTDKREEAVQILDHLARELPQCGLRDQVNELRTRIRRENSVIIPE